MNETNARGKATRRSNKSQRNVQQHFVSAAYLAGFTPDGTRNTQLYVYERNTEKMFRLVPDEAAKRRNYYSTPLPGGGFDDSVDMMLTALEGQAMPSLQKLVAGDHNLTTFERALLAFSIAFQEFRTPWTRKIFQNLQEDVATSTLHMAVNKPGLLERIFEELKAKGDGASSFTPDQLRDALRQGRIRAKVQQHADLHLVASMGQTIGNIYTRMQWTVIRAVEGEFVTSDAPVAHRDSSFRGGFYMAGVSLVRLPRCGFHFQSEQPLSLLTTKRANRSFSTYSVRVAKQRQRPSEVTYRPFKMWSQRSLS